MLRYLPRIKNTTLSDTYVHTYIHSFIHTYNTYIQMYTYKYIHTYTHTYTHTHIHTYTYTHTHIIYIYTHTYICIYIHLSIYLSIYPHIPEVRWCLEWPTDIFICHTDIWTCVCAHEKQSNDLTKGVFWDHRRTIELVVSNTPTHMEVLGVLEITVFVRQVTTRCCQTIFRC